MYTPFFRLIIFFILILYSGSRADYTFPARLDIKETSPHVFKVSFNLPMINNMKLKAELELPPICKPVSEKSITATPSSYNESWQISCNPDELLGQQIKIIGLLGTQVEIMLNIEMLNGRVFNSSLKPGRSSFKIPEKPTYLILFWTSMINGIGQSLKQIAAWLFIFLAVAITLNKKQLFTGLIIYLIAFVTSKYLTENSLLLINLAKSEILIYLILTISSLKILTKHKMHSNDQTAEKNTKSEMIDFFVPIFWVCASVLGILNGGNTVNFIEVPGLSDFEMYYVLFSLATGVTCGLIILYFLAVQIKIIFSHYPPRFSESNMIKLVAYSCLFISITMIWHNLISFALVPFLIPEMHWPLYFAGLLMGIWIFEFRNQKIHAFLLLSFFSFVIGAIGGAVGFQLPINNVLFIGSIMLISSLLIFKIKIPTWTKYPISSILALAIGWLTAFFIYENITMPIAHTIEAAIDGILIFCLVFFSISMTNEQNLGGTSRLIIVLIFVWSIVFRLLEYLTYYNSEILTNLSVGYILIPALSLFTIILTILKWPRERKALEQMGVKQQNNKLHLLLILLAFLIFPYGTIRVSNPLFSADSVSPVQTKYVLNQLLTNTYQAFNIADENELYAKLSENISGDLIVDIYLNSRRRLNVGVREGSEVKVRDVNILALGIARSNLNNNEGFIYESKWEVIARVRHLQHIHHRKNIYSGLITLKIEDDRWKIEHIELLSEDREIIPGTSS